MAEVARNADLDSIRDSTYSFDTKTRMDCLSIALTAQNEAYGDINIDKCIALVPAAYYNELNFIAYNTNAAATSGPLLLQWWDATGAAWTNIASASLVVNTTPALPNTTGWIPVPNGMVAQGDTFIRAHKAVIDVNTDIPIIQVVFRKKITYSKVK